MSLQDRIFLDFREAVETFLRMGFEQTPTKQLVRNDLEVTIRAIGSNIWRSSVEKITCRQVQSKPLNHVPVDSAEEASIQKADKLCESMMKEPIGMPVNKH